MVNGIFEKIHKNLWYVITQMILKKRFKFIGERSLVLSPLQLDNCSSVIIESDVYIAQNAWIMGNVERDCSVVIKKGTTIGHYAHIIGLKSLIIEEDVLLADKVFISDCTHNYQNVDIPIKQQGLAMLNQVTIGEGSWLGENVCVCGASIGKHCVIGANSVVTKDIPDYCVAVGSPARVVKRYDKNIKEWISL